MRLGLHSAWRFAWHVSLGGLALGGGGCARRAYYADARIIPTDLHVRGDAREQLLAEIPSALRKAGIQRVDLHSPTGLIHVPASEDSGTKQSAISRASLASQLALRIAVEQAARGAELDVILPDDEGNRRPVSLIRNGEDSITIIEGPPMLPSSAVPATADEIRARHGIVASNIGEVSWSPRQLAVLDQALSLLSKEELAFIADVPFVRMHRPTVVSKTNSSKTELLGMYKTTYGLARIELYDSLLMMDKLLFVGQPDKPYPLSVEIILHEVGHALADAVALSMKRDFLGAVSTFQDELKKIRTTLDEPEEHPELTAEDLRSFLSSVQAVEDTEHRARRVLGDSKMVQAYRWARSSRRGPTEYGETSIEEAFAEAFALFHADPAALARIDPGALAWFQKGEHLSSMAQRVNTHNGPESP